MTRVATATRRRLAALAMCGLVCAWIGSPGDAVAQAGESNWPDRPVRFIVPFPAGSASDIVARIVAQKLGALLGQQFVIDNRSGASGNIGAEAVARAAPDGYTIGLATNSTHAVAASMSSRLGYDPEADFTMVSMIGASPYVLAVHPSVPATTVAELIALAKAKPHELSYGTAGQASLAHLAAELFSTMAGVDLAHIPYRSSAQAVLDATTGRIELQFGTLGPTLEQIRSKQLRALAVTSPQRIASLPDVPTMQEAGLKGYDVALWMALVMPAGVAPGIVARLNATTRQALTSPEVVAALEAQGMDPAPGTPEALARLIHDEIGKWRALVASTGLKP
ncbi:MAG: tripartite tricarboxylate transporter substrate binding protein [Rhodoplanes sp.]|uniref:Bug family tripartite tricarboxylate transporter substrate binding protein n=1 Tax=Rhodoplanes sp. TaxID=1968906 RepID=UPI0017966545|nr:tripartite tricarboxylate transporter substrate binding protein [Rhodoplanes sp.]NVO15447.1 tripartite tricarboxylate transporter substrate binding protein [Rhodoplanes sp.]